MSNPTDMELAIAALQAAATIVAGTGDSVHSATEHVIGAHNRVGTADQFYSWLVKKRDETE